MREIMNRWLEEALTSNVGEEHLLPVETKKEGDDLVRKLQSELKILSEIDPMSAGELQIYRDFRDHRYWVVIEKVVYSPFVGWKKKVDGTVEKVEISILGERYRRIRLMKEDGLSLDEIKDLEGDLSDEEIEYLSY